MIENTSTKILYSTDGTNKVFDIPFDFINNEDVVLSVKLPTDTDFTKITENYLVNKAMATITYPVSGNVLVADSSVLIERNTPITQLESSAELHFTSSDVERGLDKITMIAQEIKNSTDGYAADIKTLRKDNDDLGDQVHNIEAKIPQAASDSNQLVDNATLQAAISSIGEGTSGSSIAGLVVSSSYGVQRGGVNTTFRTNIGTRAYKFITLELCNANQTTWTMPLHSCAGYGNRSGNFADIYVCISAKEFEDNLILDGATFGYKVTLWY